MELKDLAGLRTLSGVDFEEVTNGGFYGDENASACRFEIDGIVYVAEEDPADGYRSCMDEIKVSNVEIKNKIPPHKVLCRYVETCDGQECEVLEVLDAVTGRTVLRVGTENTDDYYPCYVADYVPSALAINS